MVYGAQPVASVADDLGPEATIAVSWLVANGHTLANKSSAAELSRLPISNFCALDCLVDKGVIVLSENTFGDTMVSVNDLAITHSVAVKLREPVQHSRVLRDDHVEQWTTLEVMLALTQEGWTQDANPGRAWTTGAPLQYGAGHWPSSYFAALVLRQDIISNGVTEILHGMTNNYYRCLINLRGETLMQTIANMEGHDDRWFLAQMKGIVPAALADLAAIEDEPGADVPAIMNVADEVLLRLGDAPSILGSDVVPEIWTRVLVDCGPGTRVKKVYFDGGSHQTRRQRGWMDCSFPCRCIKYVFINDETKELFCARLYAWESYGATEPSRGEHLKHEPLACEVSSTLAQLTMNAF